MEATSPAVSPARASAVPYLLIALALVALQIVALHQMGRLAICACGDIKFWYGNSNGPENSQQLTDWYTFSHIIHGFIFYGLTHLVLPRASLLQRLVLAMAVEVGWELIENSPFIIERYRQTGAAGYSGDSILNSLSDVCSMMTGFLLARALPVPATIGVALVMEVLVGLHIRDNLTLNVIMLLHPFEAIKHWQAGPPII
jgi:hypothetical protein